MKHIRLEADAIAICGAVTRETVTAMREELLAVRASSGAPHNLRLCDVTAIDSAGIQVLSSVTKDCPNLRLTDPSEVVRSVLIRIGALGLLEGVT